MIVLEEGALDRVGAHVRAPALVVMDTNTRAVAGDMLAAELGAGSLCLPADLHATDDVIARVRAELPAGGSLVAVGSGTLTDVVRYAATLEGCEWVSVPTAASMDGYASAVAALERGGVKVTLPARAPAAIFADPALAARAPAELIRAGIGDLLAKATARVDWHAAHLLYGEPWRPLPALARLDIDALLAKKVVAVASLLDALLQSGQAMAEFGSSRPASGCEHHASHLWDLLALRGIRPRALHGLQVGYATVFAMRLQRFAFAGGVEAVHPPRPVADPLDADARRWLGEPTADVVAAVAEKQGQIAATPDSWPSDATRFQELRTQIGPSMRAFDEVAEALRRAGIPDRAPCGAQPGFLGLEAAALRAGLRYGGRLRARYTVIDFLEGQGELERALDAALQGGQ